MTKHIFLLAAGLFAVAACTTPDAASGDTRLAAAEDENLICETQNRIGSIIPKRVCMTQEEWDEVRRKSRDVTSETQRRSLGACTPGNSCAGGGN